MRASPQPNGTAPRGGQRAHVRVGVEAFVRVRDADREYAFRTRDVSEGGIFLCTRVGHLYPFAVGDELALELHHEDAVVALHGKIVRVVPVGSQESILYAPGFGVALEVATPEQAAALATLMRSGAAHDAPPA